MAERPILIVGAGPTGLMLSAQLHRFGAPHLIIDAKPGVTALSKALAVQARTLEQYRQLGIADTAIDRGFIARSMRIVVNGEVRARVPLGEIGRGLSPYPYLFILEQSENEALLRDHIKAQGGTVRWSHRLTDLKPGGDGYRARIERDDGRVDEIACRYVVGCDGSASDVRHAVDLPLRGGTNEQLFFVADIALDMDIDKEGLLLVLKGSEFLAFFPMSGENRYRAVGVLPDTVADPDDFPFAVLAEHIESNLGMPGKIVDHGWHSGYRVHHRIVDSFRSGNVFLAGDAAHIHSPAGGQGMNTGLGDAVNLGWKLAAVINGWAGEAILDTYDQERRPFGVQLVNTTDRAFTAMVSKNAVPRFVRTRVLPVVFSVVLKFNALRRLLFKTVSQTRIAYRKSGLSDRSGTRALCSGDRFPWFEWSDGDSFQWLAEPGYTVLRFGGAPSVSVPGWSGPVTEITVEREAAQAAVAAGLPRSGVAIVRPDMHIQTLVWH